ncbi:hypothetical protein CsSME_00041113 [Camellia sinensis var. sinensis]
MLEAELRDSACNLDLSSAGNGYSDQRKTPVQGLIMQETDIVRTCYFHQFYPFQA